MPFAGQESQDWDHPWKGFYFKEGDIPENLTRLDDVNMCMMTLWRYHRLTVKTIDYETRLMEFTSGVQGTMRDWEKNENTSGRYYLDNVFECLNEPGEVYNDRETGKLYYVPRGNEQIESCKVFASAINQLLVINGFHGMEDAPAFRTVNIGFVGNDWTNTERNVM